jgi:AraC-like DNA-binding protein
MGSSDFTLDPTVQVILADLGVDRVRLLRRAGLPADLLGRRPIVLSPDQNFALWKALEAELDDPHLPIALGEAISIEAFDPAIFAALCSGNFEIAARRIATYKPLIGPMRVAVRTDPHALTLTYEWPEDVEPPASLRLAEMIFWVALARLATRHDVKPIRLTVPEPPAEMEPYRNYLGCTVEASPVQSVSFRAEDATRPFLTSNEAMWGTFEPDLRRRLAELEPESTTAERVRAALLELLPAGQATMDATAGQLAVSTRTLQRRLQGEGTTFQEVLNDTRENLARHYLTSAELTTAEISFLLGYEDPNSFHRAFQTWTGATPLQVRAGAG